MQSNEPWWFELISTGATRYLSLAEGRSLVIGTSYTAEIQVDDRTVSSRHGRLTVIEGRLHYEDLDSRNGSYAGGVKIDRAVMSVGSSVVLGRTVLTCVEPPSSDEPELSSESPLPDLIGDSLAMKRLARRARKLAQLKAPVLIHGESGSGKELVATALHRLGPRAGKPLVALNMGALPGELADAELFGHERGAFTGADRERKGAFEQARGGTLFLDEIAELSPGAQAMMLRALENGEIRPIGATSTRTVDARVVAATWASLGELVERGKFRQDLLHRLAVFTIDVPPLRERRGDIPQLAQYFLARFADEVGEHELGPGATSRLLAHSWPGNVRELRNVLLRACVSALGARISSSDVLEAIEGVKCATPSNFGALAPTPTPPRAVVRDVLEANRGNVSATARALGIARSTVRARAKVG
jgi:DNA-binding NtrC family response regulator